LIDNKGQWKWYDQFFNYSCVFVIITIDNICKIKNFKQGHSGKSIEKIYTCFLKVEYI